ncbi:dihydroxyacetone kinase subunit DhaL [Nakamurella sp.]|uniref:dihydroxyacetone kinase subunit DhaL n=1 Tax=Nakamurella sp. TaxID=1869182 RepID=UPI0037849F8F
MTCDAASTVAGIRAVVATIAEHKVELTRLDRDIGDGDHGENMARGFTAVLAKLDTTEFDTPAAVLKMVASTLISTVGGAAGPLYGTAFLRASTAVKDQPTLDAQGVVTALTAARDGVVARGKAELEDKTMVDALTPAVNAARAAAEVGDDVAAVLRAAATDANLGAEATIPFQARKGRASYLGERSIGHKDPGATSTAYLLAALADAAAGSAAESS